MMHCKSCRGRVFLDRVFSDNANFELYCMLCGVRKFVGKNTVLGSWLAKLETQMAFAVSRED